MNIKSGMNLYAKCDCMNNFRKGQMITIDDVYKCDNTALVNGVAVIGIDLINEFFSETPIERTEEKFNTLKEAAQPLIGFLNDNYDPHTIAVVREGRVDILREEMGMPLEVRD